MLPLAWEEPGSHSRECRTEDANTEPHEEFDQLKRLRNESSHDPPIPIGAGCKRCDLNGKSFHRDSTGYGNQSGRSTSCGTSARLPMRTRRTAPSTSRIPPNADSMEFDSVRPAPSGR